MAPKNPLHPFQPSAPPAPVLTTRRVLFPLLGLGGGLPGLQGGGFGAAQQRGDGDAFQT